MKRLLACVLSIVVMLSFASCGKDIGSNVILDNSENSSFVDFYTKADTVYIECVLNIYNSSDKSINIKISAVDNEDVEIGLLKSPELSAVDKDTQSDTFTLKSGENSVSVVFIGDYAGIYQISNRAIPRFIYFEKA